MRRAGYLLFVFANRIFWIAVLIWVLIILFSIAYPHTSTVTQWYLHGFGIVIGFGILRLATARPRRLAAPRGRAAASPATAHSQNTSRRRGEA